MASALPLEPAAVRRAMRLSLLDGICYALMVGFGETYFLADAVRLGASLLELGLVVSLPLCVGSLGPLLALARLARRGRRKGVVVTTATLQTAVLLGIVALDASGRLDPALLIVAVCLYQVCGQAAGTAWSSWYGDLVPADVRGRYFAGRNRAVHIASCAGLFGAAFALQRLEVGAPGLVAAGAGGAGFRLVFSLAALFRLCSVAVLAASPEPPFRGLPHPREVPRFLRTQRGDTAWRLLLATGLLNLFVFAAAPYFAPFMFGQLRFTYVEYMATAVAVVVLKSVMLPAWGRVVDAHGARTVYGLVALLVVLVPVPWLWCRGLGWVLFAEAMSGFSWAGYEVAHFTLLLDATYKTTRPIVFAALNLTNGLAQLLGTLCGAGLLALGGGNFRAVFAASVAGRLALALLLPRIVPQGRRGPTIGRRALLLRVIGFRPHGGLMHRPVYEPPENTP